MQTALWVLGTYIFICLAGYVFQRQFMYFPDTQRMSPAQAGLAGVQEVELGTGDGETLIAWYAPASSGKPTLLYFHGNGEIVTDYEGFAPLYHGIGLSLLVVDYRGYGWSTGKPLTTKMIPDAQAVLDALDDILKENGVVPSRPLFIMGRSLGSAPAICYEIF